LGIKRRLPVSFSRISEGISMDGFTPVGALAGGAMIGASAALFLLLNGRIAGISGILGGLLAPPSRETGWRAAFVAGLVVAPLAYAGLGGSLPPVTVGASFPLLVLAGLLVGFGARLGAGCTSGHGVCGIGRGSPRSLAATGTFMAVAVLTVLVMRHLVGA
jgi:uncharacterized membrane protein YedE/YeeE